jgi:hypothetical protein
MEKLSQFPFMFMICHFSYEKNIIWGETREIPRNQTHPNSDQNIGWKMRKKKHATGMHWVIDAWPI